MKKLYWQSSCLRYQTEPGNKLKESLLLYEIKKQKSSTIQEEFSDINVIGRLGTVKLTIQKELENECKIACE